MPRPLPKFADARDKLPSPIYDENPLYVRMYWKAWELAFRNYYEPRPGSGFVSQFIDAAFNQNIFLWDTCFLTMFSNFGHPLVPGIGSLDNFYAKQYQDGEICREIDRTTGRDYVEWSNRERKDLFSRWSGFSVNYVGRDVPSPRLRLTLDALNHPILAWAELESIRVTGDRSRLARVYDPLVHYYRAFQKYVRQGNGLYVTDWASMDNSPRNAYLAKGGRRWILPPRWSCLATNSPRLPTCWVRRARRRPFDKRRQNWCGPSTRRCGARRGSSTST